LDAALPSDYIASRSLACALLLASADNFKLQTQNIRWLRACWTPAPELPVSRTRAPVGVATANLYKYRDGLRACWTPALPFRLRQWKQARALPVVVTRKRYKLRKISNGCARLLDAALPFELPV
jgi:hypothetical protein